MTTASKLEVMVLESERGAADVASDDLTLAGHHVLRCHDAHGPAFPCNALVAGSGCPLDSGIVDVVLDVRRRPRSQPSPTEDGVRCAIQRHIPLVVAGSAVLNPFDEYATAVVEDPDRVVETVERAARGPLMQHTEAAARALADVLRRRDSRVFARVEVVRRHGSLVIEISGADALDQHTRLVASTRMVAAVRAVDQYARGIDVVFNHA